MTMKLHITIMMMRQSYYYMIHALQVDSNQASTITSLDMVVVRRTSYRIEITVLSIDGENTGQYH